VGCKRCAWDVGCKLEAMYIVYRNRASTKDILDLPLDFKVYYAFFYFYVYVYFSQ